MMLHKKKVLFFSFAPLHFENSLRKVSQHPDFIPLGLSIFKKITMCYLG